jgi:hypothetical protein
MAFSMPAVMRSHGLEPTLRTYHNLITAAMHNNHIKEALGMLWEMKTAKLEPTLTTYNLLMRAAQRSGPETVLAIYERMQSEGVLPGAYAAGFVLPPTVHPISAIITIYGHITLDSTPLLGSYSRRASKHGSSGRLTVYCRRLLRAARPMRPGGGWHTTLESLRSLPRTRRSRRSVSSATFSSGGFSMT